ncbi:hypothetical protein [Microbacterium sulfonylureivorans]|nr:hypothetical protein [Microbacterium sulfonylureivorans]
MNRPLAPASDAPVVAPADIVLPPTQPLDLTAMVAALVNGRPDGAVPGE